MLRPETRVRARALQLLYALEMPGDRTTAGGASGVARLTGRVRLVLDDVEPLVREIRADQDAIDRVAQAAADNWRLDRIATIERNILRIAIFELRRNTAPPKVVIDEALWLAHRFAGSRAPGFINGVLDRVARDLGRL
ncbi:MAG: transcription antitermination factor NusB [Gemmatimonadales bacterium]